MLSLNMDVFDEVITGTATTWYTSAALNGVLGDVDIAQFFALATSVRGSPSLSVYVDSSGDNQNWHLSTFANGDLFISPLTENVMGQFFGTHVLSFLRLRIVLTGTTPGCSCRLKISVTGRNKD